jgi:hypothetical protein
VAATIRVRGTCGVRSIALPSDDVLIVRRFSHHFPPHAQLRCSSECLIAWRTAVRFAWKLRFLF